jgi:adenylate kinase
VEHVIAISGTPGTGKSAVGNLLANQLNAEVIELGQVVKERQFHYGEDPERDSLIANIDSLQEYMVNRFQKSEKLIVVSGHFADLVPEEYLKILVILRCHPITLTQRLRTRQWPKKKTLENIQAEILGECTSQGLAQHDHRKIFEIDTTDTTIEAVVTIIKQIAAGKGNKYMVGKISWLRTLDPQLIHEIMEQNKLPCSSQKA